VSEKRKRKGGGSYQSSVRLLQHRHLVNTYISHMEQQQGKRRSTGTWRKLRHTLLSGDHHRFDESNSDPYFTSPSTPPSPQLPTPYHRGRTVSAMAGSTSSLSNSPSSPIIGTPSTGSLLSTLAESWVDEDTSSTDEDAPSSGSSSSINAIPFHLRLLSTPFYRTHLPSLHYGE